MKTGKFKIRILPSLVFTSVIFLIVRARSYNIDINDMPDIPINSSMELWDVLCCAKSSAIFAVTIWAVLTMAYLLITGQMKIRKTCIYIPMFIYSLAVVMSYALSDFKGVAWQGSIERFEGTRTILCYMFMLFYTINVVEDIRDAVLILSVTSAGIFLACIIGITQLAGHDFYLTDIGRALITGSDKLSVEGAFLPGQVYQSVDNMNYVGMYLSLIVPVLIMVFISLFIKGNRQKLLTYGIDSRRRLIILIFTGLLLLLIALNVYGAGSLGGFLGICVSVYFLLTAFCRNNRQIGALIGIFVLGTAGLFSYMYINGTDDHKQVEYIETGYDYVRLSLNGNEISIIYDRTSDSYVLKDGDGEPVPIFWFADQEGIYRVDDGRFDEYISYIPITNENGEECLVINLMDEELGFIIREDGVKYLNPFGNEVSLGKVDSLGFENHLFAGNGRGYIWSRTLPLLKSRLLTGSGADTFVLVFPQNDYAGKYSSGSPLQITCDKAHNLYLGMAVGTGVAGTLAFITMALMAIWKMMRSRQYPKYMKALAAGILGFLFAGIFNDSSVCIMPMFYGFLGTGIAMSNLPHEDSGKRA